MRYLFFLALLFIISYFGIAWYLSNLVLFPESSHANTQSRIAQEWGTTYEEIMADLPEPTDFSITAFDNIRLKGKYFAKTENPTCVIIAAHGWTGTWAGMLKYVPALADCSCDLVFYDHRGHGDSDKAFPTGSINESKDLIAITEWVQKNKGFTDHQVGWLGASWGGATALKAGATKKNIGFIIVDAAFQDWHSAIFERAIRDYGIGMLFMSVGVMQVINWRTGIDYQKASPLLAAAKIEEPVLLIHSKMDASTDSQQSVNISKNLNTQSVFHHLTWGGDHTQDVLLHKDKFRKVVNEFLRKVDARFLRKN